MIGCGGLAPRLRLTSTPDTEFRLDLTSWLVPSSASCMLLVMDELERGSLDPTIGRSIVAFGAAENCALESRAAIAAAGEILTDFIRQDLTDVASRREAINANAYLPPAWQIGLDPVSTSHPNRLR